MSVLGNSFEVLVGAPAVPCRALCAAKVSPVGQRAGVSTVVSSLVAGCVLFAAGAACAEFSVCNQSFDVLNVAIGYEQDGDFQTEGWWSIGANRCVDVLREPLQVRYIYVYAEDVFGQAVLEGNAGSCVDAKRFLIRGTADCWTRGHKEVRFLEVDTLAQARWTLFLKSSN